MTNSIVNYQNTLHYDDVNQVLTIHWSLISRFNFLQEEDKFPLCDKNYYIKFRSGYFWDDTDLPREEHKTAFDLLLEDMIDYLEEGKIQDYFYSKDPIDGKGIPIWTSDHNPNIVYFSQDLYYNYAKTNIVPMLLNTNKKPLWVEFSEDSTVDAFKITSVNFNCELSRNMEEILTYNFTTLYRHLLEYLRDGKIQDYFYPYIEDNVVEFKPKEPQSPLLTDVDQKRIQEYISLLTEAALCRNALKEIAGGQDKYSKEELCDIASKVIEQLDSISK